MTKVILMVLAFNLLLTPTLSGIAPLLLDEKPAPLLKPWCFTDEQLRDIRQIQEERALYKDSFARCLEDRDRDTERIDELAWENETLAENLTQERQLRILFQILTVLGGTALLLGSAR